jgi:hypothetical protein
LQDDLMRIFGSDRMDGMLQKLGLKEGEAIIHNWINKALEKAQQKVEARNFDIRKNLLKYDDVMNDQRRVVFDQRLELMEEDDLAEPVKDMRHDVIEDMVAAHIPEKAYPEQWDTEGLQEQVKAVLNLDLPIVEWADEEGIAEESPALAGPARNTSIATEPIEPGPIGVANAGSPPRNSAGLRLIEHRKRDFRRMPPNRALTLATRLVDQTVS